MEAPHSPLEQPPLYDYGLQSPEYYTQELNDEAQREMERLEKAEKLGLSPYASWAEIYFVEDQREREEVAKAIGWAENPRTSDQLRELGIDPIPTWRNILMMTLQILDASMGNQIIKAIGKFKKRNEILKFGKPC